MEKPQAKLFSQKALDTLAQFDATAETLAYVAEGGPLDKEIRSFLVSIAGMLKRDCKIQDWKHDLKTADADDDDAGYTYVRFFPKAWELPKVGPVAFSVYWINPLIEDVEDLCVSLRIPWNWSKANGLKDLVLAHIPQGFTDVYDGEADANSPLWRYLRFQNFVENSRFDVEGFWQAILTAFRSLLSLRPIIDDYIKHCKDVSEVRTARRQLGIVSVLDVETAGMVPNQEIIELAVVNAAYDKDSGQVFGIVEQYEGLREPKCRISEADQRLNGLGNEHVRGQHLDEGRIENMLKRADFVVAHHAFCCDKPRMIDLFGWAADLDWRDSLNGVNWETDERNLPFLLKHHGVDCEVSHRAGPDARALLELLSYGGSGKTYLSQLLSLKADEVDAGQ
jgi:DNA polymerase III subunit epsilon